MVGRMGRFTCVARTRIPSHQKLIVLTFAFCIWGGAAKLRHKDVASQSERGPHVLPLDETNGKHINYVVLDRVGEQLAIAQSAEASSEASTKESLVTQQVIVAQMGLEDAEKFAEKGTASVPNGRAALGQAQDLAKQAQFHADHIKTVEAEIHNLPAEAAEAAAQAIAKQIDDEAAMSAKTVAQTSIETPADRANRVGAAVAAAAEPYHLQLLRAQKYAAVTYATSQKAAVDARLLANKAQQLGLEARTFQMHGQKFQAEQMMAAAREKMQDAVKMKGKADELYMDADKVNRQARVYQQAGRTAAASVAGNMGARIVPELPA